MSNSNVKKSGFFFFTVKVSFLLLFFNVSLFIYLAEPALRCGMQDI